MYFNLLNLLKFRTYWNLELIEIWNLLKFGTFYTIIYARRWHQKTQLQNLISNKFMRLFYISLLLSLSTGHVSPCRLCFPLLGGTWYPSYSNLLCTLLSCSPSSGATDGSFLIHRFSNGLWSCPAWEFYPKRVVMKLNFWGNWMYHTESAESHVV